MLLRFKSEILSQLLAANLLLLALGGSIASAAPKAVPAKPGSAHSAAETSKPAAAATEKKAETKTEGETKPESVLETAIAVSPDELVTKPQEYLGKNVKFTANFFAWSNLALDYKPALRPSKTHLSFLILKPNSHVPLAELKLAMMIPKEKDPESTLFATLKDGDQIELVGKVFSTALDDPWMEVFKLKKLSSSSDEKDKKTASASDGKDKSSDTKGTSDKSSKPDAPSAK